MNTISRDSWHFRVFLFFRAINDRFRHMEVPVVEYRLRNMHRVDLCTYVRTILVTGPLVLLFNIAVYGITLYSLVIFPLMHYAVSVKYIGFLLAVILAIVACVWLLLAVVSFFGWTKRKYKEGSFSHIVRERNRALKDRICPVFNVERTDA